MKHFNQLSYKNNNISFRSRCQQRNVSDVIPSNKDLLENPAGYLDKNLNSGEKVILNHYLALSNTFENIFFAQSTIAKKTGYTREYVNKSLKKLRTLGLLDYNYKHMNTCDYKISSWFLNKEIRDKLRVLFSSLKYLPLIWIIATQATNQRAFTQYKLIYEDFINDHENRHDIFYFNNFHKLNSEQKRGDLDLKAFSDTLDNALNQSHNPETIFPDYIEQLQPILHLTTHGKYHLSCFSFEAIKFAIQPLERAQLTGSSWRYFEKVLKSYCTNNNEEPNWNGLNGITTAELELPMVAHETSQLNKTAIKEWLRSFPSPFKKGNKQLASVVAQAAGQRTWIKNEKAHFCCHRCTGKYCCGDCELNKGQGPMKITGKMRMCIVDRKEFIKALDSVL